MIRGPRHRNRVITGIAVGWLFADLLLALGMLFLISSTVGAPPHPTSTPIPTPTPTPTPMPVLELTFWRIEVNVQQGQSIDDAVKTQIQQSSFLQGRRVGLVIVYTGAPTLADIPTAQGTDEKVKSVLQSLNVDDFPNASYYDSRDNNGVTDLTLLGYPASYSVIDIYLFRQ